jgi:1-acyl-sn-glycerol-3-phosphate acyltransferase
VQTAVLKPLLHTQLEPDIGGLEEFAGLTGPVLIVANHASHLDTPLVLEALPAHWRRRTGVAVTGDYFLNSGWRAAASAVAFNTVAQTVPGRGPSAAPGALLDAGWNVLMFPEGHRSGDGYPGDFAPDAAVLAIGRGVRVLPVGIRGSYAAMPRGQAWPGARRRTGLFGRSRPRVSVRFGPSLTPRAGETAAALTERIEAAVRRLIAEDVGTWWLSQRDQPAGSAEVPPAGSWRRIWEQSQPPQPGGTARRPRIWH